VATCCRWDLRWGGSPGDRFFNKDFAYRVIAPIVIQEKPVAYVKRLLGSDGALEPFKSSSNEESVLPVKNTLYNFDGLSQGDPVVIVEGITDVWKLGNGAVGTYGIQWTMDQISLLREKSPKRAYVLFDSEPEAQAQAQKLQEALWFTHTETLTFENLNDPGELSLDDGWDLMQELVPETRREKWWKTGWVKTPSTAWR
jgi:DNA primase